jgi:hypothetical protein
MVSRYYYPKFPNLKSAIANYYRKVLQIGYTEISVQRREEKS